MTHPAQILSYEMFSRMNMSLSLILHLQIMVCDNDIRLLDIFMFLKQAISLGPCELED